MRYSKDHRKMMNRQIIDVASMRFRKDGIQAVGIAGLMSDAGLTHGGFYSHFKSKEDLVVKAISKALEETLIFLEEQIKKNNGDLEAMIQAYLHSIHRDSAEKGCAIAAIGPELSRRPKESQRVISAKVEAFFDVIKRYLPHDVPENEKQKRAVAIFSLMVGTLQISRMVSDKNQKDQVLQNGIDASLVLAGL